ncbi:MAG: carbonic anhydrase family protein [Leptospira sp.]|nr:carbonic anhydrase family protein [Leptospira sp.]
MISLKFNNFLYPLILLFVVGGCQFPSKGITASYNYATCQLKQRQSPINLIENSIKAKNALNLSICYATHHQIAKNLGHTVEVEVEVENEGIVVFKNKTYRLIQYHFHTPSEHKLNSKIFPMEMHVVNRSNYNEYLVIAYPFQLSKKDNRLLNDILTHLTSNSEEDLKIRFQDGIESPKSFYHYSGSLTTPPYTENVEWLISRNASFASASQIQSFMEIEGYNNRKVQSQFSRKVDIIDNISIVYE